MITTTYSSNTLIKLKNIFLDLPKKHQVLISGCSLFLLILLVFPSEKASASRNNTKSAIEVGKIYQLDIPEETQIAEPEVAAVKAEQISWQTAIVKSGDSLGKIFKRFGFSAATTYAVDNTAAGKNLRSLKVGDEINIASNDDGDLIKLKYQMSLTDTLIVNKTDTGFSSSVEQKQIETRIDYAQAQITSNFWSAALASGLSNNQTMNLANVFGWDIDFALDIREGDSFTVMFENQYVDGDFVGHGNILAAEFSNQGETFKAIRFKDGEYYAANGDSMRKSFLRAPVSFQYISSSFKPKRYHPILKRVKAHNGVDYRAPQGTPVKAAGNGRVIAATFNKYNGNYVFIQHANNIVTKYLHFSKRAVKKGARVKQGQVIGYVGSTGLSQAPHLHYEFLLNGVHRNPRTVKLPDALPIDKKYKAEFSLVANNMISQLEGSKQAFLAATDTAVSTIAE
ncbi:peptidoglycan DD-metalloendopeptidase family protein [Thalassotalea sp. ND16A]|uniref:peptidoglycan DD-metalloendopeptidase family protein n=1 Tax=Thalassotalea sp. ND16A TaxID=1535422 RepID=UPI001F172E6A|nr:peptidoglycan DD-metalloendopeptidase family protein [Thalassotalea sp. ND16A]